MNTFALTILSCTAVLFRGQARSCRISTPNGSLGLEARHEPLLAVLKEGSDLAFTDSAGEVHKIPVANGMLTFRGSTCNVTMEPLPQAQE